MDLPVGGACDENGAGQAEECQVRDACVDERIEGRVDIQKQGVWLC